MDTSDTTQTTRLTSHEVVIASQLSQIAKPGLAEKQAAVIKVFVKALMTARKRGQELDPAILQGDDGRPCVGVRGSRGGELSLVPLHDKIIIRRAIRQGLLVRLLARFRPHYQRYWFAAARMSEAGEVEIAIYTSKTSSDSALLYRGLAGAEAVEAMLEDALYL